MFFIKIRANQAVRDALEENRLFIWQLADITGHSESWVTKTLRHELPEETQNELIQAIRKYASK